MFSVADFGSRQPVPLESGQLAHDTERAELIEIQKADLGRKYARVDRRPLDPPPVVLLKLYHVLDPGTEREAEREISNYDEVQNVGLICTVDLFPVPGPGGDQQRDDRHSPSSGSSTPASSYSYNGSGRYESNSAPPRSIISAFEDETDPSDIVHHVNTFPVAEGTKVTGTLVGQTVVQPNIVEYQGQKALVFVFADLAVKIEGNFILRYRVFDLYASKLRQTDGADKVKMQAECYGGPFRVYSTKEFPGLQASTELTKHLARWGVRLNIRETERRRRKKAQVVDESSPYTTKAMKRKWPEGNDGPAGYHEDDGYASADD